MSDNYRYNVRDPHTHRFTKLNLAEERPAMTIDNETHEVVNTNVPATLDLAQDETMIRSTLGKFADGIVSLSKFAKQVEDLERKLNELQARLGEATTARDAAVADAAVARHDAEMARQAYDTANTKRIEAEKSEASVREQYKALFTDHETLKSEHSFRGDEVARLNNLLTLARDERDRFRTNHEDEVHKRESAEFTAFEWQDKHDKLSTTHAAVVDELATTKEALDICARTTADWRAKASDFEAKLGEAQLELSGIHHKVNALEDDNNRQVEVIKRLQNKVSGVRSMLND